MKKPFLIGAAGVLLLVGALFYIGQPKEKEEQGNAYQGKAEIVSAFQAQESAYDFGTVRMANGNVNHVFSVRNAGETPMKIEKIFTSCMCTTAFAEQGGKRKGPFGMPGHGIVPKANIELAPGEEIGIDVVFNPNAHGPAGVGPIERQIYLVDEKGAEQVFAISGTVTP
ncbi:MAG: DUF1573 domain-containing protein [bacterium]|nr:DUF1573 domain-containing protein [bacterium]